MHNCDELFFFILYLTKNIFLDIIRGGATVGHKGTTAPLTFYKHVYA